jgi:hypothetical protein
VAFDRVFRKLCIATALKSGLQSVALDRVFRKLFITRSDFGLCLYEAVHSYISECGLELVMLDCVSLESWNIFTSKFGLQPVSGGLWVFRKLNS